MSLIDQFGRPLHASRLPRTRPSGGGTSAPEPSSYSWGLYPTPQNTGEQGFYRPRSSGLRDLGSLVNGYDWQELIDLSRQIVSELPDLGYSVLQKNQYAVGDAWHPEFIGANKEWGEAAEEWLEHVWMPQASMAGGFFDWQRDLLVSAMAWDVDGDDLAIFVIDEDGFPKIAYRTADQVGNGHGVKGQTDVKKGPFDGAKICNGVIEDRLGRRIGIRVLSGKTDGDEPPYTDLAINQCDLAAEPFWRVQKRGLPRLSAAIMGSLDVQDIMVFLKRGIKLANAIGLVHYNEGGEATPGSDIIDERVTDTSAVASDIKIERRMGGEVMYMRANMGEKLEEVLSKRPSGENMTFLRELRRNGLLSLGWFIELLDPERVGGASMRAIQDQARHSVRDRQKTIARRAKRAVLFALAQAMETGRIPRNDDAVDWMRWGFGLPAQLTVDAGYDEQADRENLIIGTTTFDTICQKKGARWRETREQRQKENVDLIDRAIALMTYANGQAKTPDDKLTLRDAIALVQGSSNAPENLRAQLTKSTAVETQPATKTA